MPEVTTRSFPVLCSLLRESIKTAIGRSWEQTLLLRKATNVLSYVPYKEKKKLACYLKQIFNSPNRQMATAIAQMIPRNIRTVITK